MHADREVHLVSIPHLPIIHSAVPRKQLVWSCRDSVWRLTVINAGVADLRVVTGEPRMTWLRELRAR